MVKKLYERYYQELIAWTTGMTGERAVAEDFVQEAFLRALHHASELEDMSEKQGRAWLYRAIKNLYIDKIRHARFETIVEEFPEASTNMDYDDLEREQLLSDLQEKERKLFSMRYFEGYNSTELGEIFHMSPATVRMKLASARKHLQRVWEE